MIQFLAHQNFSHQNNLPSIRAWILKTLLANPNQNCCQIVCSITDSPNPQAHQIKQNIHTLFDTTFIGELVNWIKFWHVLYLVCSPRTLGRANADLWRDSCEGRDRECVPAARGIHRGTHPSHGPCQSEHLLLGNVSKSMCANFPLCCFSLFSKVFAHLS